MHRNRAQRVWNYNYPILISISSLFCLLCQNIIVIRMKISSLSLSLSLSELYVHSLVLIGKVFAIYLSLSFLVKNNLYLSQIVRDACTY